MSARTKNKRLAIDVAMAIFRRGNFTQLDIRWMHAPTRAAIASEVGKRNETILARIAVAYPGLPIELEGGRLHGRTWVLRMATEVVIQVICDICGVNPVWGERGDNWMFLGRMLRSQADKPGIIQPNLIVDDAELVDLWATESGRLMVYCGFTGYGPTGVDDVERPGGLGSCNSYLREAARRYRLLQVRLPAVPEYVMLQAAPGPHQHD